ncbi:MAG: N-acetyl-gamma-glutamyl-phosphate reductase [Pirellulales bacterium]|nr:N-acetyl-gamma-glutamyl-phosphate reductase [Pirellulales bacterium]
MPSPVGKIRVAVLGATGYTALELIKILLRHPHVQITAATSRSEQKPIGLVHQSLAGRLDLRLEDLSPAQLAERADCIFSCLPHGVTADLVPELLSHGLKIVDFSADYRLDDGATYLEWYDHPHADPARLGQVVYGLPELFGPQIRGANLVANNGCYTATAILALAPLVQEQLIETRDIIIDAKSGVSGAGRAAKQNLLYCECNESLSAYGVGKHRHTPEIEQIVRRYTGQSIEVIFTPHLVPMDRGILATIYSRPTRKVTMHEILDLYREFYRPHPFVTVVEHLPATKDVSGTNYCHLTARIVRGRIITIACLDNLIKGASGGAVQNFNWMYGFDETLGLI